MRTAGEVLSSLPAALTDKINSKGKAKAALVQTGGQLAHTEAVRREIERCGCALTAGLVAELERKERAYGVTGFQTAAAIARALKKIAGKKTFAPRSDRWILAVVENDFAASFSPIRRGAE